MKFLVRTKPRAKRTDDRNDHILPHHAQSLQPSVSRFVPNPTVRFPGGLLETVLSYSCPQDDSYKSSEDSMVGGGCMLCDLKDLSQCALVNKQWSKAAQNVMYRHVRIDAVHYCDQENELALKRKRRSFTGRKGNATSAPQERLQLLARTVRENGLLARKVQYLKTPYMTREGAIADLARTVSFLPNLLYVDLPDGVYSDDPSCDLLKQELQSRCSKIRYMKYNAGSEGSFRMLAHSNQWRDLETLELSNLAVEPSMIINVLVSLKALHEVKLANMPLLDDNIFTHLPSTNIPFPPLTIMTLQDVPHISAGGLVTYLSQPGPQTSLSSLTLVETGISALSLHQILCAAPKLKYLRIVIAVSRALPAPQAPPLASSSLQTLHYEISNAENSYNGLPRPSESYYAYLSSSILSGSLPSLTRLYALSITPQELLKPAMRPTLLASRSEAIPPPISLGLEQPLRLFTKTVSELEWNLTLISPPSPAHRRGSTIVIGPESLQNTEPLSLWHENKVRQSIIVGNGFGGFLAIPSPGFPPESQEPKMQKIDSNAWMG